MTTKKPLRSQAWFGRQDKMGFYYRSFLKNRGFPQDQFEGRPVIGICNTWSELNPCNSHFHTIAEHVRYGVLDAGGFPLEFPVSSLGEVTMRPTAMLYRNLASMDVEEAVRAHPLDGVVSRERGGKTYTFTRCGVITHVTTHGMHHRAQCLNMLRQLGVAEQPASSVLQWMLASNAAG